MLLTKPRRRRRWPTREEELHSITLEELRTMIEVSCTFLKRALREPEESLKRASREPSEGLKRALREP
jgi:hypothetical protein